MALIADTDDYAISYSGMMYDIIWNSSTDFSLKKRNEEEINEIDNMFEELLGSL